MEDEIGSAAELFDVAELREVVMHHLGATREAGPDAEALGLPPEALYAPGSPEEPVAMELRTRVGGLELRVRIAVQTRNAYAAFWVDAEAVFGLPAPIVTGRQDIVQEFTAQVGGPSVFPYVRAAVASLAAQLSVPASPLPLLHVVDMELATADLSALPDTNEEDRYVHGTFSEQSVIELDSEVTLSRVERSTAFIIDTQTQQLVQVGDDTLDVGQVDVIAEMLEIDPSVFWPHLRVEGESDDPILGEEPSRPTVPDGVLMTGTMTKTADDGSIEVLGEFFVDAETGALVRFGGEGLSPEADELLDSWAELASGGPWVELAHADELTWQSAIRDHGVESARQFVEDIRSMEGDPVAGAALAMMETALASIALEDAAAALDNAMNRMALEISLALDVDDDERDLPRGLFVAAQSVIAEWEAFKNL